MKKAACVVLAVLALIGCAPEDQGPPKGAKVESRTSGPPNVIVILTDDLGFGHVSAYGGRTQTPNIDALARDGARFTNAHTTAAVCGPSRAGLLTGRIQNEFGFEFNQGPQHGDEAGRGVPLNVPMIQEVLKKDGYTTGLIGKWHLGRSDDQRPNARGFDEFFGILEALSTYLSDPQPGDVQAKGSFWMAPFGYRLAAPIWRNEQKVHVKQYLTDAFTQEAVSFVDRKADKPFFLYLAYNAPHTPLEVTKKYLDRVPAGGSEEARIYDAMILAVDDGIGAIVAELKARNLYDNTIIVFASDNGCPQRPGAKKPYCSNAPYGGSKNTFWDGGHHVPLIIKGVNNEAAGAVVTDLVSTADLTPTFTAAAGIENPPLYSGVNLLPLLSGKDKTPPHDWLAWRAGSDIAILKDGWKLYLAPKAGPGEKNPATAEDRGGAPSLWNAMKEANNEAERIARMPFYRGKIPANWEVMLYDMNTDISEKHNLAIKNPEQVKALQEVLDQWVKTLPEKGLWGPQSIYLFSTPDGVRIRVPG